MSTDDTAQQAETGADTKALNNNSNQAGAQAIDNAELERLRKEAEQAKMRANQLENQLKAKQEAEEAEKAKQLAEQNEFKTLYEQERAKSEELRKQQEEKERQAELDRAKTEALNSVSQEAQTLASELGITLTSADEDAVEAFKAKLAKVQERISSEAKITPNNPGSPRKPDVPEGEELRFAVQTPQGFEEVIAAKFPGIAAMRTPKK